MGDIEKEIIAAKSFLFGDNSVDKRCQKVWYGATESIKDYFDQLNWEKVKKILTVCSSGDHIFNLVNKGISRIDTFDKNPLTFPYTNLRMALLLASSYDEFFKYFESLTIYSRSEQEEYEIFSMIKPFIRKPYDYFWEELYKENLEKNKHGKLKPGLLSKMCIDYSSPKRGKVQNLYLSSEEEYNITKQNLADVDITFQCADIYEISNIFEGGYDKILLSNIWNYINPLNKRKFYDFIVNQLNPMLNTDGETLAAYLYNLGALNSIAVSDSNYHLIEIPARNIDGDIDNYHNHGVLVYKKK